MPKKVRKCKRIHKGPRGGRYIITANGTKVYVGGTM